MANRYAVKSGNWSDVTVWDGGVSLPGAADSVWPNNFVVTIDQDVSVAELRNDASAPAAASGYFTIIGNTRSITASAISNKTTTPLETLLYLNVVCILTINGPIGFG